jgi:hypothetical protein
MARQYFMTTTGTLSPVVIDDLGGLTYTHPTSNVELTLRAPEEDIFQSITGDGGDLGALLDAGHITMEDEKGNNVTSSYNADIQSAQDTSFENSGTSFTGDNVQSVLSETDTRLGSLEGDTHTHANKTTLDAITAAYTTAEQTKLSGIEPNAKDDQAASEVPVTPTGNLTSTDVQAALEELQSDIDGIGVGTGDMTKVVYDPTNVNSDAFNADNHVFDPNGDITATNVQAAIVEVRDDTDTKLSGKADTGHTHTAADITDFDTEVSNNTAVAANTAKVTNASHTGDVTGDQALTIAADAVDNTKLANMNTATLKGRVTAGTGDPEDLTAVQVRTLLNVEDSAAADQNANEVPVTPTGNLTSTDVQAALEELQTELDGISGGINGSEETFTNSSGGVLLPGAVCFLTASDQVDKARADSALTMEGIAMNLASLTNTASGSMKLEGPVTLTTGEWDAVIEGAGTGGLTPGAIYFVSTTAAGEITTTAPGGPNIIQRVGTAKSATVMLVKFGRPLKLA